MNNAELQKVEDNVTAGLLYADTFISKKYLLDLKNRSLLEYRKAANRKITLFDVTTLVFDKDENVNDKLINIYSALYNVNSSIAMIIDSKEGKVTLYVGVAENGDKGGSTLAKDILCNGIKGNFPGSVVTETEHDNNFVYQILAKLDDTNGGICTKNVVAVSVVPSLRDEADRDKYIQGIEKFIDSMGDVSYTAVILAEPVDRVLLEETKHGYENIYSDISPYKNKSVSYGENESYGVSKGLSNSFTSSINRSVSQSNSTTESSTSSSGSSDGSNFNFSGDSFSFGSSSGSFSSDSYTTGSSFTEGVTEGKGKTSGQTTTDTESVTQGSSKTLTINYENKLITDMMGKIDQQLERIKMCESFGMWNTAAYFISDDIHIAVASASTFKALVTGQESGVENSYLNTWTKGKQAQKLLTYLKNFKHPLFEVAMQKTAAYKKQKVTPANMISGKELPVVLGLPRKSVNGVQILSVAEFGRNVVMRKNNSSFVRLGKIYHMHEVAKNSVVNLDLESLRSHCFVTGSTGAGKSNTTYKILQELIRNDIKFMVIEPAKGEYKKAFGKSHDDYTVYVFGTNPKICPMLRINPFSFPSDIHILEHLDRLIEIFSACWPLYAAMPAILKEAIEIAYVNKGWDLTNSMNIFQKDTYPVFKDLEAALMQVINSSGYSAESKGDYIGALVTRVKSLSAGISGQIFCAENEIADEILFDENVIVDLSRVGSMETKSLIMGLLVLKLNEYRMSNTDEENAALQHITVLEEAHNLLKRTDNSRSEMVQKSVEMICNSIAEMRTYGEGFIIVDQSPNAVDIAAIKNTNTKIIMRLPETEDRKVVGYSAGLNDSQVEELTKLEMGVAAVYQNNWKEPVLVKVDYADTTDTYKANWENNLAAYKRLKSRLLEEIYNQYKKKNFDFPKTMKIIKESNVNVLYRTELENMIRNFMYKYAPNPDINNVLMGEFYIQFLQCRDLFRMLGRAQLDEGNAEIDKEVQRLWNDMLNGLTQYLNIDNPRILHNIFFSMLQAEAVRTRQEGDMKLRNMLRVIRGEKLL